MSPAQALLLIWIIGMAAGVATLIIIDFAQHRRRLRAERRAIDEHTDDFWRQVG